MSMEHWRCSFHLMHNRQTQVIGEISATWELLLSIEELLVDMLKFCVAQRAEKWDFWSALCKFKLVHSSFAWLQMGHLVCHLSQLWTQLCAILHQWNVCAGFHMCKQSDHGHSTSQCCAGSKWLVWSPTNGHSAVRDGVHTLSTI